MKVNHTIDPIYDKDSVILILGSFPSVKSREGGFFYHHPRNRFWKVTAAVLKNSVPQTIEEKRSFLSKNRIALWDVIKSCEIENSSDSSIRKVEINDIEKILKSADIRAIFTNGGKASSLYAKHCEKITGVKAHPLPSTSPANASLSIEGLIEKWSIIKDFIF